MTRRWPRRAKRSCRPSLLASRGQNVVDDDREHVACERGRIHFRADPLPFGGRYNDHIQRRDNVRELTTVSPSEGRDGRRLFGEPPEISVSRAALRPVLVPPAELRRGAGVDPRFGHDLSTGRAALLQQQLAEAQQIRRSHLDARACIDHVRLELFPLRSEERRVGKGWRCGWWPQWYKL